MNILNKKLEERIEEQGKIRSQINIAPIFPLISFGIQIILVYLIFIYLIGYLLASLLNFNNLYFLAIILGTVANVNSMVKIIRCLKNDE